MMSKKSAALSSALEAARTQASDLSEKVAPTVAEARERIAPVVSDARERIAPVVSDARERLNPVVHDAKVRFVDLAETVTAKLEEAEAATASDASAAKETGSGGRLKKFLLVGVVGAVVAFVVKKMTGSSEPQWQSTAPGRPVPPASAPAPTDAASAVGGMVAAEDAADPLATDVAGGGTPDEAAADAVDGPHTPTTPDAPAEEINLDRP